MPSAAVSQGQQGQPILSMLNYMVRARRQRSWSVLLRPLMWGFESAATYPRFVAEPGPKDAEDAPSSRGRDPINTPAPHPRTVGLDG